MEPPPGDTSLNASESASNQFRIGNLQSSGHGMNQRLRTRPLPSLISCSAR